MTEFDAYAKAEAMSTALKQKRPTRTSKQLLRVLRKVQRSGFGASYTPSIEVRRSTAPLSSHATRLWCAKCGRSLHLLSDIEYKIALVAMYLPQVLEIHEQKLLSAFASPHPVKGHPLWLPAEVPDSPGTALIAQQAGIRHPMCSDVKEFWPLSTDLFLYVRAGNSVRCVAWTCKARSRTHAADPDERMLEKLEIERRLYQILKIPFLILSPEDFPQTVLKNLDRLRMAQERPELLKDESLWRRFLDWAAPRAAEYSLVELWKKAVGKMPIDIQTARDGLLHAVWTRQIRANLFVTIHPERALPQGGSDIGRTWAFEYLAEEV